MGSENWEDGTVGTEQNEADNDEEINMADDDGGENMEEYLEADDVEGEDDHPLYVVRACRRIHGFLNLSALSLSLAEDIIDSMAEADVLDHHYRAWMPTVVLYMTSRILHEAVFLEDISQASDVSANRVLGIYNDIVYPNRSRIESADMRATLRRSGLEEDFTWPLPLAAANVTMGDAIVEGSNGEELNGREHGAA